MTDITLHGTGNEISKRVAEFKDRQLTVTIHMAADHDSAGPEETRIRDEAHLEALLQEGLQSGMEDLPPHEWEELRKELHAHVTKRQQ